MAAIDNVSPVRQQYLDIKRQHPEAILFFRLGDFYETFDEDAELVARELDIVLTSRNVSKGNRVPMAGVPHHAAENYLAKLIERGHHVAICEQVGDEPIKGLMPREVVRILTPGTVVEPGLLPGDANNYLAAVVIEDEKAGVAYADVTTGEFAATELDLGRALRAELVRLAPAAPGRIIVSRAPAARRPCWPISAPPRWMALAWAASRWPPAPLGRCCNTCRPPSPRAWPCSLGCTATAWTSS
jgi:DNA mismatch repair ATPase MutS